MIDRNITAHGNGLRQDGAAGRRLRPVPCRVIVGRTHDIRIGARSKIPQVCSVLPSPQVSPSSVTKMRVPSQLLVIFAFSAVVGAYAIPQGGKYPSSIANLSFGFTVPPLTGNGDRSPYPERRSMVPDAY